MKIEKSEILQDALNFLDDEMIEEVEELRAEYKEGIKEINTHKKKRYSWNKWSSLTACVCVLMLVSGIWCGVTGNSAGNSNEENIESVIQGESNNMQNNLGNNEEDKQDDVSDENINMETQAHGVTLPAYQVNLGKGDGFAEADMALLFIYEGRCYVQTCDYMSKSVVGEYVCSIKGLVDEWTEADGYVELAGSYEGDIYTVKGVDPKFMLCTVYESGVVETFTHNNGITLSRGKEILKWLEFEVEEEYTIFCSKGNSCDYLVEDSREILDEFFESFAENEVVLRKDISAITDEEDIYHLVIVTEEGVPLHFEILSDGYVSYYGLNQVCVKVDEEIYKLVIGILEER